MIYKILLDHKKLEEERNPDKNVNKVTHRHHAAFRL